MKNKDDQLFEIMDKMGDDLKNYKREVNRYLLITGITKKEYDWAIKMVKKLIKHLKNHDVDEVFEQERLNEYMNEKRFE